MDLISLAVLNIIGIVLIVLWLGRTYSGWQAKGFSLSFFTTSRLKNPLTIALLIFIPAVLVNQLLPNDAVIALRKAWTSDHTMVISVIMAFLISLIWAIYARKLDIYEPENWRPLVLTFILSCVATEIVVMELYGFVNSFVDRDLAINGSHLSSFLYCVFVIGGIEEFGKMIPIVLIWYIYRNAINEPYDYILYGSISALGFAFVENIQYIYSSELYNIGGRALYASVAHMTFTSTVCYGIMLHKYRFTRIPLWIMIPAFFGIAMFSHGFYDFWLITPSLNSYSGITSVFFLITVHIWFTMKNNAINVSNFFRPEIVLRNDRLRYYLIVSLVGLLMLAYVVVAIVFGREPANQYLLLQIVAYGYIVIYLAFGLSRYQVIQNVLKPMQIPFNFLIPKALPEATSDITN